MCALIALLAGWQPASSECFWSATVEVWEDVNGDGIRDPGEPPLPDIRVITRREGNADPLSEQRTGPDGAAQVGAISQVCDWENFQVTVAAPAGYTLSTTPLVAFSDVAEGGTILFGLQPTAASHTATPAFTPIPATSTPPPTPTRRPSAPLGDAAPVLPPFNPCDILSDVEVEGATGIALGQPPEGVHTTIPGGEGDSYVCDYPPAASITTNVPAPAEDLDALLAEWLVAPHEEVSGVGDRAHWVPDFNALHVIHRNVWLEIRVVTSVSDYLATARSLARFALPHLDALLDQPVDEPAAAPFAVCDSLTRQQAESILGPLASNPRAYSEVGEGAGYFDVCVYEGTLNMAAVRMQRWPTPEDARGSFSTRTGGAGEAVADLGDAALWDAGQLVLFVRRGTLVLDITMINAGGAREQAIQIAQIAAVRIP